MNDKSSKKAETTNAPAAAADGMPSAAAMTPPAIARPQGLTNIAATYPLYDGGDARTMKIGTRTAPLHGLALGVIDLPSQIRDEDGKLKEWKAIVIELLQPAPCSDPGEDSEPFYRNKGERVLLNLTKAAERFQEVAKDPNRVYEIYVEPMVSKVKSDPMKRVWTFPVFEVGDPINPKTNLREPLLRTARHNTGFTISSQSPTPIAANGSSAPQLPSGG